MRIKYERTGGFAGMKMSLEVDTQELPEDQAEKLIDLLDDADFEELPAKLLPARPGMDQFTYKVEIDGKRGRHAIETSDSAIPEKVRPLIDFLGELARTRRK